MSKEIPFTKGVRVYFLMQDDYVAYIGQTTHLAARIATHVADGKTFDSVAYKDVCGADAVMIEAFNINYHNPELNQEVDNATCLLKRVARSVGY
ncbi:MAG TPA: hypothetical protein ENH40_06525 [Nitrospirae bacterium]|nr:hypothetical protein [Nitrospirota bacterium]